MKKISVYAAGIVWLIFFAFYADASQRQKNIRLGATALLLDDFSVREKYSIPMREVVRFINSNSRFRIHFSGEIFEAPHTYTFYDCAEGARRCVLVNKWDIDADLLESVPARDFYMLLWESGGNPPFLAGGTWGVSDGILKEGVQRPYSTVPVDPWWFNNEPFGGFNSRAAQIMTHEVISAINAKLEVAPYNCMSLTGDPGAVNALEFEKSRLAMLTDDCIARYLEINR